MSIRRVLALLAPLLVLGILYAYTAMHQTQISNADGVYYNECCGKVYLQGQKMATQRAVVPVHQAVMKFGLTVYLEGDPRLFSKNDDIIPLNRLPSLQFDKINKPDYFDVSDTVGRTYRFYRCNCIGKCCKSRI